MAEPGAEPTEDEVVKVLEEQEKAPDSPKDIHEEQTLQSEDLGNEAEKIAEKETEEQHKKEADENIRKKSSIGMPSANSIIRRFDTEQYTECLLKAFKTARRATLAWCWFVAFYWTVLAIVPAAVDNDLLRYQYYTWLLGMVGVVGVYYAVKAGHPADSKAGKPIMAFATAVMGIDWFISAYYVLDLGVLEAYDGLMMFFHGFAILWATMFFYNQAISSHKRLAWLTLLVEWIDLISMCVVILVIHSQIGDCFDLAVCWGYFFVLGVHLCVWFTPIIFSWTETDKRIHWHMIILDTCTDLPIVVTVILDRAYEIHWVIYIDIVLKIFLLIRSYSYHGLVGIIFHGKEEHDAKKAQNKTQEGMETGMANQQVR